MESGDQGIYQPASAGRNEAGQVTESFFLRRHTFASVQSPRMFLQVASAVSRAGRSTSRAVAKSRPDYVRRPSSLPASRGPHEPFALPNREAPGASAQSYEGGADLLSVEQSLCIPCKGSDSLKKHAPACTRWRLASFGKSSMAKRPHFMSIFLGCLLTLASAWAPRILLGICEEIRLSGEISRVHTFPSDERMLPSGTKDHMTEDELQRAGAIHQLAEQVIQNLESRGFSLDGDKIYSVLRSTLPQLQFLGIDAGAFEEAFRQIVARRSRRASQRPLDFEQVNQRLTELAERLEELQAGQKADLKNSRSSSDGLGAPHDGGFRKQTSLPQLHDQRPGRTSSASKGAGESRVQLGPEAVSETSGMVRSDRLTNALPAEESETEVEQGYFDNEGEAEYWQDVNEGSGSSEEAPSQHSHDLHPRVRNFDISQKEVQRTLPRRSERKTHVDARRSSPVSRNEDAYAPKVSRHPAVNNLGTTETTELEGQQISLTLHKSVAGNSATIDKAIELTLDHHRPSVPTCANNNGRPPAHLDVPLVAASFDAPGAGAVAILGRFRNDASLLLDVFAESVIESLPPELKRRWRLKPEEIELYSIKDCDLTIYVHCNYIHGRPDPNLGSPLVCNCSSPATTTNTSDATALRKNSYVRIEWNLLDLSWRGRKGTTELVKAVNADLQRKGKCAFMAATTFGRTLSTVLGYPVRTTMAYYSICGAFRPGCRKPGTKPPQQSFPHPHPLPPPLPPHASPDPVQPGIPSVPQPRPPYVPPSSKPVPAPRPPLVPPKPSSPFDCVFVGVDFFGFDVAKDETGEVQSASECAERCKFELTCFYWTFNQRRHWCYLKNALAPLGKYQDSVTTRSLVSGVKGCNALPDAYPSEPCYVRDVNIVTDPKGYNRSVQHCLTPMDCHAACVTDPACFYWVFDERRRACTVKGRRLLEPTRLSYAIDTTGLTSGAKRCPIEHAIGRPRRLMDSESSEPPANRGEPQENACFFTEGDLCTASEEVLENMRARNPTECRTRCVTHAVNTFNSRRRNPLLLAENHKKGPAANMLEECVFWRFDGGNGNCTLFGRDAWRSWKNLCYQDYIEIVPQTSDLRLSVVPEVTDPGQCDLLCASQSKCISWTFHKGKKAKNSTCTLFQGNAHKKKVLSPAYHLQQSYPQASHSSRHRSDKVNVVSGVLGARPCSQESVADLLRGASSLRTAKPPLTSATSEVATEDLSTQHSDKAGSRTAGQTAAAVQAERNRGRYTGEHGGVLEKVPEGADAVPHDFSDGHSPASSAVSREAQNLAVDPSSLASAHTASVSFRVSELETQQDSPHTLMQTPLTEPHTQKQMAAWDRSLHSSDARIPPCSQAGLEFAGHDLLPRTLTPTAASTVKCLTLCAGTKFCFFWTYDAQNRLCYLKDLNAPSHALHGRPATFISGSKYCPPLSISDSWAYNASGFTPVAGPAISAGIINHRSESQNQHKREMEDPDAQGSSAQQTLTSDDSSLLWNALSGKAWSTPGFFASWLPTFDGSKAPEPHGSGGFLAKSGAVAAASNDDREEESRRRLNAANLESLHGESPYQYGHLPSAAQAQVQHRREPVRVRERPEDHHEATSKDATVAGPSLPEDDSEAPTHASQVSNTATSPQSMEHAVSPIQQTLEKSSPRSSSASASTHASAATANAASSGPLYAKNEATGRVNSETRKRPTLKCKEEGVALLGGDLIILGPMDGKDGSGAVETPAQCALLCIHNAGCSYWTLDLERHTCYLKAPSALQYYTKNKQTRNFVSGPAISTHDCPLNLML